MHDVRVHDVPIGRSLLGLWSLGLLWEERGQLSRDSWGRRIPALSEASHWLLLLKNRVPGVVSVLNPTIAVLW